MSNEVLCQLYKHYDKGDTQGVLSVLFQHRAQFMRRRPTVADVTTRGREVHVRPLGPRIGEREALIIRTETNRALLALDGSVDVVIVDLRSITTFSTIVIGLVDDLRRNARLLGAKVMTTGAPAELVRSAKKLRRPSLLGRRSA